MRFSTLLITAFFTILNANASSVSDTIIVRQDDSAERITRDLDSLINTWYVKIAVNNIPDEFKGDTIGLQYPDSVYERRLTKINSIISLPYNSIIRNHIHVYT